MPFFKYSAKNKLGELVKGKVEAKSLNQAASVLSERGLLVISVRPLTDDTFAAFKSVLFGIKQGDVVNFTRQLSTMVTAGLPLSNALSILVRQGKPEVLRMVATILQEVEGGSTFSKALGRFPKVFTKLYVQLVFAGEAGGVLEKVLERLAENMEKSREFRSKTRGALIYPVIVMIAMIAVAIVMVLFVIPKLTVMYKDFGAELPLPTRILMGISDLALKLWWAVAAGAVGLGAVAKRWLKTPAGKLSFDRFLLKVPIIGVLLEKVLLTEFARTMSLLLTSGVSLLQSLDIVTTGINNTAYEVALRDVTKQVEKGITFSQALGRHEMFPPILHQMVSVGEETGKLDEVLMRLANYFESESEQAVKNMTAAIEPMIMIVLGLGVGAMVLAIILPIYNLTSQF